MRHDADLVTGPLYDYLGHWGQRQWLLLGHNEAGLADENEPPGMAEDSPGFGESSIQGTTDMPQVLPGAGRTGDQNEFSDQQRALQYSGSNRGMKRMNDAIIGRNI